MKILVMTICIAAGILLACTKKQPVDMVTTPTPTDNKDPMPPPTDQLTYLALGDSYTIGESVETQRTFPYQLVALLKQKGLSVAQPVVIARTGWTTGELISAINQANNSGKYNFVTLLIGVNNQYRGYSQSQYRTEFVQLLNTAIAYASGNIKHVFVVSIPDYSVTPFAASSDKAKIAREIDEFNAINLAESQKAGVNYCNITPISRGAASNPKLIAQDGLHPSGDMYALWAGALLPMVTESVK